ncbi:MAG: hypothetical protein WC284_08455 [Candidimonas sp.]
MIEWTGNKHPLFYDDGYKSLPRGAFCFYDKCSITIKHDLWKDFIKNADRFREEINILELDGLWCMECVNTSGGVKIIFHFCSDYDENITMAIIILRGIYDIIL